MSKKEYIPLHQLNKTILEKNGLFDNSTSKLETSHKIEIDPYSIFKLGFWDNIQLSHFGLKDANNDINYSKINFGKHSLKHGLNCQEQYKVDAVNYIAKFISHKPKNCLIIPALIESGRLTLYDIATQQILILDRCFEKQFHFVSFYNLILNSYNLEDLGNLDWYIKFHTYLIKAGRYSSKKIKPILEEKLKIAKVVQSSIQFTDGVKLSRVEARNIIEFKKRGMV